MKKNILYFYSLVLIFTVAVLLIPQFINNHVNTPRQQVQSVSTVQPVDTFSYNGKEGTDALTLLKQKAEIKEKQPGFVISINNRAADSKKHEFWSFYVNGKMAEVGAGQYVTKNTDRIEWKIDTY